MTMERLTDAEEEVMLAIWDCKNDPGLREVVEKVNCMRRLMYGKEWKTQTVSTFMAILRRKNYIVMKRNGRICTYQVKVQYNEYRKQILKDICIGLYKDDKEQMIRDLQSL